MSLRKFEIHFDEEKVREYGKYSIGQLYAMVDILMEHRNIDKLSEGVYQAREDNEYYDSTFGAFLMALPDTEWFMYCADKWLSYHDDGVDDVLEILQHYEE